MRTFGEIIFWSLYNARSLGIQTKMMYSLLLCISTQSEPPGLRGEAKRRLEKRVSAQGMRLKKSKI